MKPISFPSHNVVYGGGQPEYFPLPAYRTPKGTVISCWKLSWRECLRLLLTRKVWLLQLTFGAPLQPQFLQVDYPFETKA